MTNVGSLTRSYEAGIWERLMEQVVLAQGLS